MNDSEIGSTISANYLWENYIEIWKVRRVDDNKTTKHKKKKIFENAGI